MTQPSKGTETPSRTALIFQLEKQTNLIGFAPNPDVRRSIGAIAKMLKADLKGRDCSAAWDNHFCRFKEGHMGPHRCGVNTENGICREKFPL